MKTALAAAILATMLLATTAQAATDPRKCGFSTDPKACARQAAENALKLNMSRRDHVGWSAVINCAPVSPWLVWRCTFRNAVENGSATITFRALANGWHTRVALAS